MDYNKLNNFLVNLKIDENAEHEKRKQQVMNRDFNFLNENQDTKNILNSENFNIQTRVQKVNQNQTVDLKGDINDRLNTREYIPNSGKLNIHGRNFPIMDRFPKSSRDLSNSQ